MSCNCANIYGSNAWMHTECGNDPCPITPTSSDNVVYSGTSLPCTGIDPNDTFTVALQKIDGQICALLYPTTTTTTSSTTTSTTTTTCAPFPSSNYITMSFKTSVSIDGVNYIDFTSSFENACAVENTLPALTDFTIHNSKLISADVVVGFRLYDQNATTLCNIDDLPDGWYISDTLVNGTIYHIVNNTITYIGTCSTTTTTTTTILN